MATRSYPSDRFEWLYSQIDTKKKIIDIGSGDCLLWRRYGFPPNLVLVDINDWGNNIVADAHNLPFKDKSFDYAILAEILEHVENPKQVLKEAERVSRIVVGTVPDEENWLSLYRPFMPLWKLCIIENKTPRQIAQESNKCRIYNLKSIFHHRHFNYETLKNLLGEKYKIIRLQYEGWSFLCFKSSPLI
ncbi:MAG: hypothetical protein DRP01_01240 [Archaeoglobales archaeon]|nr:MAG: hypothetical protein DRP01_01240 [Archaeoglobales archaeon]